MAKINIRVHPLTVKFGEVECCALKTAITTTLHKQFIDKSIKEAKAAEPKHNWSVLTEIFINTIRIVFIPARIHRTFYFHLALYEKVRLQNPGSRLSCDHTVAEHIRALDNICFLMACPKGEN